MKGKCSLAFFCYFFFSSKVLRGIVFSLAANARKKARLKLLGTKGNGNYVTQKKKDLIESKINHYRGGHHTVFPLKTGQVYNLFQSLWNKPSWVSKQLKKGCKNGCKKKLTVIFDLCFALVFEIIETSFFGSNYMSGYKIIYSFGMPDMMIYFMDK